MSAGKVNLTELAELLADDDAEVRRRTIAELPGAWVEGVLELLTRALADSDWRVRREAVARVVDWPDADAAVAALRRTLRDEDDVGWRNAVVEALIGIGAAAVDPLIEELAGTGAHRKFVVDILGAIGESKAVAVIVELLDDDDANLRVSAAEALRDLGGELAVGALRGCLVREDLQLRVAALDGLDALAARIAVAELLPSLGQPILRKSGLRVLGWSGDVAAVGPLIEALNDSRRPLHAVCVVALANLVGNASGADRAAMVEAIASLPASTRANVAAVLASPEIAARRAAAAVLGAAGAVDAVPMLAEAMADPEMARTCAEAIASLGSAALAPVVATAADADDELRVDLFDLIATLGPSGVAVEELLVAGAEHEDEEVAAAAVHALGELIELSGEVEVAVTLARALQDDSIEDVAGAAATALGRLGGRKLVAESGAWLESALDSSAAEVRAAAALALAELGEAGCAEKLSGQLADDDAYARLAAIRALAMLGAPGRELLTGRLKRETDAEMVEVIRVALADGGNDRK